MKNVNLQDHISLCSIGVGCESYDLSYLSPSPLVFASMVSNDNPSTIHTSWVDKIAKDSDNFKTRIVNLFLIFLINELCLLSFSSFCYLGSFHPI